jgi:hypothetical protein
MESEINVHALSFADTTSKEYSKARYHYLYQILFAETIAVDFCRTIATFAPTKQAADFLLQQQIEEDEHLEMLTQYIENHPRPEVHVSFFLKKIDLIIQDAIARRDYIDCIFIQNFIIEGLNVSLLKELAHHTDGELSEVISIILQDEVKHVSFGVQEIKRILKENKSKQLYTKLRSTQRKALMYGIGFAINFIQDTKHIGIPMSEYTRNTMKEHYKRIIDAGFPLSVVDRFLFKSTGVVLSMLRIFL